MISNSENRNLNDRQHLDEMAMYFSFQVTAYLLVKDNLLDDQGFTVFINSGEKLSQIYLDNVTASQERYEEKSMVKILKKEIENYPLNWNKIPDQEKNDIMTLMQLTDRSIIGK